jgi:hypothetical protein
VLVSSSSRVSRAAECPAGWPVPEDETIRQATDADYRYIGVDTTCLDVGETVRRIQDAILEIHTCNGAMNARFCPIRAVEPHRLSRHLAAWKSLTLYQAAE